VDTKLYICLESFKVTRDCFVDHHVQGTEKSRKLEELE
jgi:hypothetical protein